MDKKCFLISSYTGEPHGELKRSLLLNLCSSLRSYFPDSFLFVNEGFSLEESVQKIINYGIIDHHYDNFPHGKREALGLLEALDFLERNGFEWVHKLCYDIKINDSNVCSFSRMEEKAVNGIEFVAAKWRVAQHTNLNENAIGTWMWYGKTSFAKKMIVPPTNNTIEAERQLFYSIKNSGLLNKVYLFEHANEMLNNTWLDCGDIINDAGKTILNKAYR